MIDKDFLVFKNSGIKNQESQKVQSVVLKLLILYYFEGTGRSPNINIQH